MAHRDRPARRSQLPGITQELDDSSDVLDQVRTAIVPYKTAKTILLAGCGSSRPLDTGSRRVRLCLTSASTTTDKTRVTQDSNGERELSILIRGSGMMKNASHRTVMHQGASRTRWKQNTRGEQSRRFGSYSPNAPKKPSWARK